jgi:branched-chain amino acid transport system permease protein
VTAVDVAQALWLLLAALGLSLSVRWAGLPVLGQSAFVAVGGFGTALLGPGGEGLPLPLACAFAVLAAGVLGHLVALGASRLAGAYLALATWGLAWLVDRALAAFPGVSGGAQGLVRPSPAHLVSPVLGLDVALTPAVHVALALVMDLLAMGALLRLRRGPGGLDLAALRTSPALAGQLGVPVAARRRAVLTVTAAVGALSGAGTVVLLGLVAPSDVGPLLSLQLFVAVLVGPATAWWGPVLGVALLTALPPVADALARLGSLPEGRSRGAVTAALLLAVLALRRLPSPSRPAAPGAAAAVPVAGADPPPGGPVLLEVRGARAVFGELVALDGVDLDLRGGEVHALVGPNGSGKSTLLRAVAGDLPGASAQLSGDARVVRTPQATLVPAGLDVAAQVAVGARGGDASRGAVVRHLLGSPSSAADARRTAARTAWALRTADLSARSGDRAEMLPAGEQRLLQVARAVATGARVLLLDEPAAGMSEDERGRLRTVLRGLAGNGCAVLLVEHDMRLVGAVADRVTVLDAGRVVASGRPDEVRADPAVRLAYLGGVL